MGMILDSTPEMGEYAVEVRSESFYLSGEKTWVDGPQKPHPPHCDVVGAHAHQEPGHYDQARHSIIVYPEPPHNRIGTVELLLEDIPKLRASLYTIEAYLFRRDGARPQTPLHGDHRYTDPEQDMAHAFGFREGTERAVTAYRAADADFVRAMHTTIGFFASVIKSGEPWTPDCQAAMDTAVGMLKDRGAP